MIESQGTCNVAAESTGDSLSFRKLLNLMPQLGWTATSDGHIDWYNQGWYQHTCATFEQMQEQAQGWGCYSAHDSTFVTAAKERWVQSIGTGDPFEIESAVTDKHGTSELFLTRIDPIRDDNNTLIRWVGISTAVDPKATSFEALATSRAQIEAITNNATGAIFFIDKHGKCTFANPSALAMTQYTWGELRQQILHDKIHWLHPDGSPFPIGDCSIDRVLPENYQLRHVRDVFVRKDGSFFDVEVSATPVPKGVSGTVIEVIDVSSRVKLERDAEQTLNRFKVLAETLPQLVWIADENAEVVFQNERWSAYTGSAPCGLIGKSWEAFVHPDDLKVAREKWVVSFRDRVAYEYEQRIKNANGQYRWFVVLGMPVPGSNLWFGTCTDIHETRNQTEELERLVVLKTEELRSSKVLTEAILESISDAIIVAGEDGEITYLNKAARELHGPVVPHSALVGDVLSAFEQLQLDGQPSLPIFELPLVLALNAQRLDDQEMIIQSYNNSKQIVASVSARPLTDPNEKLKGLVLAVRDISLRKEAEKAMEMARDKAIAVNEAKTRFLAIVSHEVRTPLAGVMGLVELIGASSDEPGIQTMSDDALLSCKQLLRILNDLLDASKLDTGTLTLERRTFAIRPVLQNLVQLLKPKVIKSGLILETKVENAVPELICGDEMRVRQLLHNIAFNAVKFTHNGRVDITVDVLSSRDGITTLMFKVSDTGIGITEEQQADIFKPFTQAADSISRVYGGSGLGLSICQTLVDLMGGELGVQSRLGEGSTFWFSVPFEEKLCQS